MPPETVQEVLLSSLFVTSCISPSSTKVFLTKKRHIDSSSVRSITLSENTPGLIVFSFYSAISISDTVFLFAVTVIAAAFHAQIFFNCSNSLW